MRIERISQQSLESALALRDLTDARHGRHALQDITQTIHEALARAWDCHRLIYRATPVVSVQENYDDLGYPPEGGARDARYTRYVTSDAVLRTQTSAALPRLLRALSSDPPEDQLLVCPGLVYRRDVIDRLHVGEPHQIDLWRIKKGRLENEDLHQMIALVVDSVLRGRRHRTLPAEHPYTRNGLQIDVEENGAWIEIGECGLACPDLLRRTGLDPNRISGLAMGLGLDRLLMLRKGIGDIRLLRSEDPRVASQMQDLEPYRPVSNLPAVHRDLSVAVPGDLEPEEVGDIVRSALGENIGSLESLEILNETSYDRLPSSARARMGMATDQKNLLVRLIIRHPTRTLTSEEANRLRDEVYLALHRGSKQELASS